MCPKPITSKKLLSLINNQATISKLRTLSAITDKLQNRYFDFWHKLLFKDIKLLSFTFNIICSQYPTQDLSAFRESGYNPSSPKIAILIADL
jgi:hypothetical protein